MDPIGFWSYVREDDSADNGRISRLAKDVVAQYEVLTGERIELFLDKNTLEWGDEWRKLIDDSLATVAFFIPVITPRYFMRPECRRELQFFEKRTSRGIPSDLILPLHYVDTSTVQSPDDDLLTRLRRFQWEDWRDIRFKELTSEEYRRGVAKLAARLVEVNKRAETSPMPDAGIEDASDEDNGEADGLIDRLARAEGELPRWADTINAITEEITLVGNTMTEATAAIQRQPANRMTFARRQGMCRQLATKLQGPTARIRSHASKFVSQLYDVDDGFQIIINQGAIEVAEQAASSDDLCQFFGMVRQLASSAMKGLRGTRQLIASIAPLEKISRDLRPVLRELRQGLATMSAAGDVTTDWVSLIDASGIDCPDTAQNA